MSKPSDSPAAPATLREQIIGLGESSLRKSYFPQLQKQLEELRASEAKYRRLHESMMDAFVSIDMKGRIQEFNEVFRAMLGYEPEELRALPYQELAPEKWQAVTAEIMETQVLLRGYSDIFEKEYRRKDGTTVPVEVRTVLLRDESGQPIGMWAIVRDITRRKEAEEKLRRHQEHLQELVEARTAELAAANKDLQTFASAVSHDLRAPLRAIYAFAELLAQNCGDKLDKEGQDYLERLQAKARHMGQLIEALLQLSRVTRGELRREQVDLSQVALEVGADLRRAQPERSVDLTVAPDLVVQGDPVLLRAVLQNLLGNAWKFTVRAPQPHVEFGLARQEGKPAFYVRDNGVGFNMEAAAKLFAPFQRLHDSGQFPGTGIGLATVRQIIHRHGGDVWAEGAENQGATFYFTLP